MIFSFLGGIADTDANVAAKNTKTKRKRNSAKTDEKILNKRAKVKVSSNESRIQNAEIHYDVTKTGK